MSVLFLVLFLIAYLSICYQDFRMREVYLITYAVLYGLFLVAALSGQIILTIDFVIVNSCILIAVTCLLFIYYLLRYRQSTVTRLKASIGLGDILMLPAFILSFSPVNLIGVYTLSLLAALVYNLINGFRTLKGKTIPLAGVQSLVLSGAMLAEFMGLLNMQVDFLSLF